MRKGNLLISFLFLLACSHTSDQKPTRHQPLSQNSKIKISFVGDIIIHKQLYQWVIKSTEKKFSSLWKNAIPFFESADYAYANLEGPTALGVNDLLQDKGDIGFVYDGKVYSGDKMLFNYHPQLVEDIRNSGIDIISTANNHILDRGSVGIDKTIDVLRAQELNFFGSRKKGEKIFHKVTSVKNFKIAWIACTEMLNGFKDLESQTLLCFDQSVQIVNLILEIKKNQQADIVIVTPHWGNEYKNKPTQAQQDYAHLFLDSGADVIIGSHPHVLQPVEQYKTKDGRETFIAYSLGNFVSGQAGLQKQSSAILFLEFEKNPRTSWIVNYSFQPIAFHLNRKKPEVILVHNKSKEFDYIEKLISRKYIPLAK